MTSLAAGDWMPWVMALVDSVMEEAEARRVIIIEGTALIVWHEAEPAPGFPKAAA